MNNINNLHNIIDLKMSLVGLTLWVFTSLDIEILFKIIGSILFIAYTLRRWFLMEKHNKNDNLKF